MDYCKALYAGLPKQTISRLQLIHNVAASRVHTHTHKYEHIAPVLKSLHKLPVQHGIDFKILLIVYKALNGLAPQYISDLLTDYSLIRPLRSSGAGLLAVPRIRCRSGEGALCCCGPALWNKLPADLRSITTVFTFKSKLKTFLFSQVYG